MYVYTKLLLSDNLANDEFLMNLVVSMMLRGYFIEKITRIINNSIEIIYNATLIIYQKIGLYII
jgi:hypothetical protein